MRKSRVNCQTTLSFNEDGVKKKSSAVHQAKQL